MILSKSDYMMYLCHPAWLWLKKHDKSKLPPIDAATQAIFDSGHAFEAYAESLYPDSNRLAFSDYHSYLTLPARTTAAISSGAKTIFQGRLEADGLTCIFDILHRVGDNQFDLVEIKSSTHVKEDHLLDLSFQQIVLEGAGYQVRNISVSYVNGDYVKDGEIDPAGLVATEDVTEQVQALRDSTLDSIKGALDTVSSPTCPDLSPALCGLGSMHDWLPIYRTLRTVESGSIYDLCRLTPELVGELEELRVDKISEIPDSVSLNKFQTRQVQAVKSGEPHIDHQGLASLLKDYQYPLYFLDYETFSTSIPVFDGLHPYEQIPFQYSLHVIDRPGSPVRHLEYLHDNSANPATSIVESLHTNIGPIGSIIAWYASFEKGCHTRLARLLPAESEYLLALNERVVDLMTPFASGFYTHPDFLGSSSIKRVLPVLVPELSYAELEIHEGNSAQRLWMDAVLYSKPGYDKAKILSDLRDYCELDTLAMVRIYQYLLSITPNI